MESEKKSLIIRDKVEHLVRHESGKLIAILTKVFGTGHISLAEDLVQDTLLAALEKWEFTGIPKDPLAWIYATARNKAINMVKKEKIRLNYTSGAHALVNSDPVEFTFDEFFSEDEIKDDVLKMMFTCCHQKLSSDSQVILILKTLCGFSVREIARAFLSNEASIEKRLGRSRQIIRESNIEFAIPEARYLPERLDAVLTSLYLLFNEGYCATSGNKLLREDLCEEATRLCLVLAENSRTAHTNVFALLALMYFNMARFNARLGDNGNILLLSEQDRTKWDEQMLAHGFYFLSKSINEENLSAYHLQAAIAACHCSAASHEETDWHKILTLYNQLQIFSNSPITRLNRLVAFSKVYGAKKALHEIAELESDATMANYYLLPAVKAEFYSSIGDYGNALNQLEKALLLTSLEPEIDLLNRKRGNCLKNISKGMSGLVR